MVPRGSDCSNPDEVLTFQLSLTARAELAGNGKPLARVEYNFGNCGWTVPMVADPADASGPRTGLILDGANNEPRVAVELLGEHEARAEVRPGIGLGVDDERVAVPGVSGDPLRGSEYCQGTNLAWALDQEGGQVAVEPGRYVIELGANGLPLEDADGDGVTAAIDNCDDEYNPLQTNKNNSEFGDVCDRDIDGDLLENALDNCIFVTNARQEDADGDGEGDACDVTASDVDRDGWFFPLLSPPADGGGGWWAFLIEEDNCPQAWNRLQWDFDSDGRGDTCDDWEDTFVYFLSQLSKSGSFDELKGFKSCDGGGESEQSSACDAMRWAVTEVVWANIAVSLTKAELDKMLVELFAQWSKTKATFAEFLTWSAEKQRDLSKKYR